MRKTILLISCIFFLSLVSAELIINEQPEGTYNLGDSFSIPVTIKSASEIAGIFQMDLICEDETINFYKNGIKLEADGEKTIEPALILDKSVIGNSKGTCRIKGIFKNEEILTKEFEISDLIEIQVDFQELEFDPGEKISIEGTAIRKNGINVEGFIEVRIIFSDSSGEINQIETIREGHFSVEMQLPDNVESGAHLLKLIAYEKDIDGKITNTGFRDQNIAINQIPSNLEIIFEEKEVEPGTNLKIKTILHDQSGKKMERNSIIKIKNGKGKTIKEVEKFTDEFFELPISYNEAPQEWTVEATAEGIKQEEVFNIIEKKEVKVELDNKTIIITNIGNVIYEDNVIVKIGEEELEIFVKLKVDETKSYLLSAPEGEYQVEIISDEEKITDITSLTGKSVDIKEISKGFELIWSPMVWAFIIAILAFIAFMIFKKGYKRSFFGHMHLKKRKLEVPLKKEAIVKTNNKAELSLSLKGNKQDTSLLCLRIKNLKEIESKKSNAEETLQKIVRTAEESKTAVYQNQEDIFFILAPAKTKTFDNEKTALKIAQKAKNILDNHNKLFKQKIDFGISLNHGSIIAKQEGEVFKFMSMGTLITDAKKIAHKSEKEILLSDKMKNKLSSSLKTEKQEKNKLVFHKIKEIKNTDEHKKFIRDFLDRIEKK